jgi:hypothetical protein
LGANVFFFADFRVHIHAARVERGQNRAKALILAGNKRVVLLVGEPAFIVLSDNVHEVVLCAYFFILGEPLRAQKKQPVAPEVRVGCFFCGSRRAIRSITFAGFTRSVVPLLSLSQKRERSIESGVRAGGNGVYMQCKRSSKNIIGSLPRLSHVHQSIFNIFRKIPFNKKAQSIWIIL